MKSLEQAAKSANVQCDEDGVSKQQDKLRNTTLYYDYKNRGEFGVCDYVLDGQNPNDGSKYLGKSLLAHHPYRCKRLKRVPLDQEMVVVERDEVAHEASGCEPIQGP